MANSITISGVHAGYGAVRVLEDVSLDVRPAETVVLLGTNGNGKSTLMKCIMGMVRPSAGTIVAEIDGRSTIWSAARPRRSSISASRWCPKGGGCFPSSPSRRTCCSARSARPRASEMGRNLDFCYEHVRPAEGAAPPARRLDERRRAADAGARARADERAAHPAGGRALGRARADPGEPHHRHDQGRCSRSTISPC